MCTACSILIVMSSMFTKKHPCMQMASVVKEGTLKEKVEKEGARTKDKVMEEM